MRVNFDRSRSDLEAVRGVKAVNEIAQQVRVDLVARVLNRCAWAGRHARQPEHAHQSLYGWRQLSWPVGVNYLGR